MAPSHDHPKWPPPSAFVWLVLILLGVQWLEYSGWLAGPTGRLLNILLSHGSSRSDGSPSRPVVTVEIDDHAYTSCFSETSPMNPTLIQALVARVLEAGPPVIGVDILTDSQKYSALYRDMAKTFRNSKVIWAAGAHRARVHAPSYFPWLIGMKDEIVADPTSVLGYESGSSELNPPYWAIPLFPRDDDSAIRRLPLQVTMSADVDRPDLGVKAPHWAHLVASEYCAWLLRDQRWRYTCPDMSSDEVLIPYGDEPPFRFSMDQFFQCDAHLNTIKYKPEFEKLFKDTVRNRAVLIGGTFSGSGDFHESPIGRIPGLLVNAYAVEQVQGGGFYAIRQPWAWIIDLALGLFFAFLGPVVERRSGSETHLLVLFGGVVLSVVLVVSVSVWEFFTWRYILGIVTIGIGLFLHELYHLAHTGAHGRKTAKGAHRTNPKRTGRSSRPGRRPE